MYLDSSMYLDTDNSQLVSTTINRAQKLSRHLSPSTEIQVIHSYCLSVDIQTWNNSLLLHDDSSIAAKYFFSQNKSSLDFPALFLCHSEFTFELGFQGWSILFGFRVGSMRCSPLAKSNVSKSNDNMWYQIDRKVRRLLSLYTVIK